MEYNFRILNLLIIICKISNFYNSLFTIDMDVFCQNFYVLYNITINIMFKLMISQKNNNYAF